MEFRIARTKDELEQAYSLVYREYLRQGYVRPSSGKIKVSWYNALPGAATFIGITPEGVVVETATIVPDIASLGLPAQEICADPIDSLRKSGMRMCEVVMLASSTGKPQLLMSLFQLLLEYARDHLECDGMCIAVHPRRKYLFAHLLFRVLCPVFPYEDANGAPAIVQYVDIHALPEGFSKPGKERLYDFFVRNRADLEVLEGGVRYNDALAKYFLTEKSNAWQRASDAQKKYLKAHYPAVEITRD